MATALKENPTVQNPIPLDFQNLPQSPQPTSLPNQQLQTQIPQTFNPMTHIPPKYTIEGYLKPPSKSKENMNILNMKDQIKIPWNEKNSNASGAMTQSELLALRRKERVPDISYDLDKDGYVGGRDFVIAKRFDLDGDGKLNEQEKKAAYEGLANNIEDNYYWNVDNRIGAKNFRLLQKRGKIIDAEDFLPVRDTYPKHPLSDVKPAYATFTELKEKRKAQTKKEINDKIKKWEEENPTKFINEEQDLANLTRVHPKYTSIQQIKDEEHRNARIKCGLEPVETHIKDIHHDPTLEYVYNPKHKTKGDLEKEIKRENLEESKKLMNMNHKDEVARLNEREDEIFSKMYSNEDRKTFTKIKEQRRKETNEYNIKTFSKQTIGVHGHELPKFSESEKMKEWWKFKDGYVENPKCQSWTEFTEAIKYFKPPGEDLLLNEHRDEEPNWVDPFKRVHVPLPKENKDDKLIIKINNLNHFKGFDPNHPQPIDFNETRQQHIYRWTTLVNQFAPNKFKKGRFFDSIDEAKEDNNDNNELYSQFANFNSNYMNMFDKKNSVKMKEQSENVNNESLKVIKDSLFQKFSNKDQTKNTIPKNTAARTKAF
jgi:hypothetical protein